LYEVVNGGGFCLIPGALDEQQQQCWIRQAIVEFMRPPNSSTLDAHYHIPENGLYSCWKTKLPVTLKRKEHPDDGEQRRALPVNQTFNTEEVSSLLIRKMRWTTLGYQYDWTAKEYNFDRNPIPFPSDLAFWCKEISSAAGFGEFIAEAGIVNMYQTGDTLTGHVDRSERNMNVPLISLSLGANCIYLLGGASRNDPVLPILVRSGDIMFMSGPSRLYYHGVPRILDRSDHLSSNSSMDEDTRGALEILGSGRININIRQVQ